MKRKNSRKFAIFTALTALWMIVIFLFSSQPAEESYRTSDLVLALQQEYFDMFFKKLTPFIIRKAAHMAEFGLLALLSLETLKNSGFRFFTNAVRFNYFTAALLFTSFYAFTDELHQLFVPGRNATVIDWLFDSFGAIVVLWVIHLIARKKQKRDRYV